MKGTISSGSWDGSTQRQARNSGSAVRMAYGTVRHFFTAAGRRGEPPSFEQRLFESRAAIDTSGDAPRFGAWEAPTELVAADGRHYAFASDRVASARGIMGFRDPGYFRDPADGAEYLLFVGSAGWVKQDIDGVVGVAKREGDRWTIQPPLIESLGVNSELERPHIIVRDGLYYCFWSTQGKRFAPGLGAPTGLYAMVADSFAGPWRPVNGTGLVAGNPVEEPTQAYCWWVTGEGDVTSFVDYWGMEGRDAGGDVALRRERFGGTAAPWFRLAFDGDRVTIA